MTVGTHGFRLLRPVHALTRAAHNVKAGEYHISTGVTNDGSELGELARVFDEMASAIEQRDIGLKQAADALQRLLEFEVSG